MLCAYSHDLSFYYPTFLFFRSRVYCHCKALWTAFQWERGTQHILIIIITVKHTVTRVIAVNRGFRPRCDSSCFVLRRSRPLTGRYMSKSNNQPVQPRSAAATNGAKSSCCQPPVSGAINLRYTLRCKTSHPPFHDGHCGLTLSSDSPCPGAPRTQKSRSSVLRIQSSRRFSLRQPAAGETGALCVSSCIELHVHAGNCCTSKNSLHRLYVSLGVLMNELLFVSYLSNTC